MFVLQDTKAFRHWIVLTVCCLQLLVVAACGGSSGTATQSTPAPSPTALALTAYTGVGYTMGYPRGWKASNPGQGTTAFSDSSGKDGFTISVISNPNESLNKDQVVERFETGLESQPQLTGVQNVSIAPTTTVGGETWSERAFSGVSKGVRKQIVMLADNHPAKSPSTNAFVIAYGAPSTDFSQANTTYFQPMLRSYTFKA